jgi:SagB-type dehydrogenase family enzyme
MKTEKEIGDQFQDRTKYLREKIPMDQINMPSMPDIYKEYPDCEKIALPPHDNIDTPSLRKALNIRKSIRHYSDKPISQEELSFLLWASGGIQRTEKGRDFRTAPSAGSRYPIETYVIINNVRDLKPGLYHYNVKEHALDEIKLGTLGEEITSAALDQEMCASAPLVIIWTAVFRRSKWRYGQRAYRYIYLDAGHIAQNLALSAAAIGLGSCQIGALLDEEVNRIVGIDGKSESIIYMSVAGYPTQSS